MCGRVHKIEGMFEKSEAWLQMYLANHPKLLPMRDLECIESSLRLVGREILDIDLLFVDERGLLTVVETKLVENPEARREVIAQLLDYAAALSKMDIRDLCLNIARLHENEAIRGLKGLEQLSEALNRHLVEGDSEKESVERAKAIFSTYVLEGSTKETPSKDSESFLKRLDMLLAEGSFRLVIVTYEVSPELLDVLNYTNSTMQRGHQLIAVELSKEDLADGTYFVPHLVGAPQLLSAVYYREEAGKRIYRNWSREQVELVFPTDLAIESSKLIDAIKERDDKFWHRFGKGKNPSLLLGSSAHGNDAFLTIWADGKVTLYSKVGAESRLSESQKKRLLSLYASTPYLKESYEKVMDRIEQEGRWIEPRFDLKGLGREGERWKMLLELLEEFDRIVREEQSLD